VAATAWPSVTAALLADDYMPRAIRKWKNTVRDIVVGNASRNLVATLNELNPVLRGWTSYFRLTEVKGALPNLDGWIHRRLRCLLWRQWKSFVECHYERSAKRFCTIGGRCCASRYFLASRMQFEMFSEQ
jgi:hypothetical protein